MIIFRIVKDAIDTVYSLAKKSPDEIDALVRQSLTKLSVSYGSLRIGARPDYSYWSTWIAYIYKYLPAHSNFLYQIVKDTPGLPARLNKEEIRLCSIGGGPGSDILAIGKYLSRHRVRTPMRVRVYDRELGWENIWKILNSNMSSSLSPEQVTTRYCSLDLDKSDVWGSDEECLNANIFTIIFFYSETRQNANTNLYLERIFKHAQNNSIFIFLDNNTPEWYQKFDEIASRSGLSLLAAPVEGIINIGDGRYEEKTLLEPYRSRYGSEPKLDGNVAWRVYVKE